MITCAYMRTKLTVHKSKYVKTLNTKQNPQNYKQRKAYETQKSKCFKANLLNTKNHNVWRLIYKVPK